MRRATLDELAKTAGRDPKSICSVPPGRDTIMRLEEAEADRVTLSLPRDMGDKVLTELEAMAKQVLTAAGINQARSGERADLIDGQA